MPSYEELIDALVDGDRSGAARPLSRDQLSATLDLADRYARIEKKVLGGAKVAFSPTSLEVESHRHDDVLEIAEWIAVAERARLNLPSGPIFELVHVIEEQGIKVLPRHFPPEYSGGFFFNEKLGPCVLVQGDANDSALQYSLAHQYAHFIVDCDPYISTLCGWPDERVLADPHELRAHHTALALLMPRADLDMYRQAFGGGSRLQPELVHQLRVYFELDPEQIFWRLLTLGWIDAAGLQTLLESDDKLAAVLRAPARPQGAAALLPERFVRLVASAFGSGKIDIETAARFLGTNVDGAEDILSRFEYEQPQASPDAAKKPTPKRGKNGNGSARRSPG